MDGLLSVCQVGKGEKTKDRTKVPKSVKVFAKSGYSLKNIGFPDSICNLKSARARIRTFHKLHMKQKTERNRAG